MTSLYSALHTGLSYDVLKFYNGVGRNVTLIGILAYQEPGIVFYHRQSESKGSKKTYTVTSHHNLDDWVNNEALIVDIMWEMMCYPGRNNDDNKVAKHNENVYQRNRTKTTMTLVGNLVVIVCFLPGTHHFPHYVNY